METLWDAVRRMRDAASEEQNRIALELMNWLLERDVKLDVAAEALLTAYEFVRQLQLSSGTLREAFIRSSEDIPDGIRLELEKSPDSVVAKPSDGDEEINA